MTQIMHSVDHQSQTQQMSCWAASAAMLIGKTEAEILDSSNAAAQIQSHIDRHAGRVDGPL